METMDKIFRLSARKLAQIGEALGFQNLDNESGKIFETGGTGVVGHRVAQRLLDAKYPELRLGAHQLEGLEDFQAQGAEVIEFAWDREETYAPALEGIKSVLCTIPYQPCWSIHFPAFLKACRAAGVKHIVKISFYHANYPGDPFQDVPLVREHRECDEHLIKIVNPPVEVSPAMAGDTDVAIEFKNTHMSYTLLYASHFMSNPFTFQGKELRENLVPSTYYGASHNRGVNYISPNDVAEVAMRCLLEPRAHYDKEYTLTGPAAITDQEVADLLSHYLNKPIMYVDEPLRLFTAEIRKKSSQTWMAEDLVAIEKVKATGKEEDPNFVSNDVEKICGHPPESFQEYLERTDMMIPLEAAPANDVSMPPMKATISA